MSIISNKDPTNQSQTTDDVRQTRSVTNEAIPYTGFSASSKNTFFEDSKKCGMVPLSQSSKQKIICVKLIIYFFDPA